MEPEITKEQYLECVALSKQYAPVVLPVQWKRVYPADPVYADQYHYESINGLRVIFTADNLEGDGKTWLHVSLSRKSRIPTYEDMCEVKDVFVGRDRQALQIFVPASKHINIHKYCLHLWCCIEGDNLPDFGRYGTI